MRLSLGVVPHYDLYARLQYRPITLSIRFGSGMGFYGDNWEPVVASIERGQVQFIASDHLAELTLAILQKGRQRDPTLGYTRDVLPMLMHLWPMMALPIQRTLLTLINGF